MTPDFEYFFWASPVQGQPLFALYDVFDNHFMIQSYSYSQLYDLRKIIRSKTMLEIVELSNVENLVEQNIVDNSVIELWGMSNTPLDLFGDARPRWQINKDPEIYYESEVFKTPILTQVDSKFDNFKLDLQKQIFFIHYCLAHTPTELAKDLLRQAVELGVDYKDVVDRFLDLTKVDNKQAVQDMIYFLRFSQLFYE